MKKSKLWGSFILLLLLVFVLTGCGAKPDAVQGWHIESFKDLSYLVNDEWDVTAEDIETDLKGQYAFYSMGDGYDAEVYVGVMLESKYTAGSGAEEYAKSQKEMWGAYPDNVHNLTLDEWSSTSADAPVSGYRVQMDIGIKHYDDIYFTDKSESVLYHILYLTEDDSVGKDALDDINIFIDHFCWIN